MVRFAILEWSICDMLISLSLQIDNMGSVARGHTDNRLTATFLAAEYQCLFSKPANSPTYFFGGRLIALHKKSGGIRPIAVGITLCHLASKCASSFGVARLASVFSPRQLGVGTPGGCEAAIHSARRYLQSLAPDHVIVKLDFENAFKTAYTDQTCCYL